MELTLASERKIQTEDPLEAERIVRAELEASANVRPLIVSIDGAWNLHIDIGLALDHGTIQV